LSRLGVLHVIDTLEIGGAERVAVNLINGLPRARYVMHLCTTRREGPLGSAVAGDVGRLCLGRRTRVDVGALRDLIAYIRRHDIRILHAHGTAIFAAVLASWSAPHLAVVWHDHFGDDLAARWIWPYWLVARRVNAVIAVSERLAAWSRSRLRVPASKVRYIPNFVANPSSSEHQLTLPGVAGRRIVCVANLRPQKDHVTLLRALEVVVRSMPNAHLLLVAGASDSEYARMVRREMRDRGLEQHASLLIDRRDVSAILQQCDIGVLSSSSEGLPLALLEYGTAGLAVVATDVGQCGDVLAHGVVGRLVPPGASDQLATALLDLLRSPERRAQLGAELRDRIGRLYGRESVLTQVCSVYDGLVD
jgi:glycosyltransferase involved in cell wall biosynthesis